MSFFTKDKSLYKAYFTMTLTIALQNVIVYGVNLADNIMIGAYSQTAMSGIAQVNQVQFLLQMLTTGASEGIVVIASRCWGNRDLLGIKKSSGAGMYAGMFFGIVTMLAMLLFPHNVISLLTNEQAVIDEAVKYSRIVCFSYPFFAATTVLTAVMRSVENVKVGMYVSLSALFTNMILNYLLIYGVWIFPQLGVRGAAIATLISRIVELCVIVCYIAFKDKKMHFIYSDFVRTDKPNFKRYIKVALPVIGSSGIWGVAMGMQSAILGHLGEDVIAANSIAGTVFSIVSVVVYGSASASSVVIGKALGEGKRDKMPEYCRTLQIIYIGIGLVTGAVLFLIKDPIVGFYNITDGARELAIAFMTVNSVTVIGTAYQMTCLSGICRGGGDTMTILINDTIFMWLIVIPISYTAAFLLDYSPVIVFCCLKCDQILKSTVAFWRVNSYKWIKKVN